MKAERIQTEIGKIKSKMSDLQARLKDLERQKTENENTEIIAAIRSANVSTPELIAFIQAFKTRGTAAETLLEGRGEQEREEQEEEDDEEV